MSECRPENYASGKQCAGCGRAWGEDGPEECPIEPIAEGRWETGMEHAARDMRDGRFPERSERQRVPAPAMPDNVAKIVAELRVIGCHENGDARCTCGIGMDAADALEAQAAELVQARRTAEFWKANHLRGNVEIERLTANLARIKSAADKLVNNPGWGTVNYTDGDMWADADKLRAALTHPTRGSND